MYRINFFYIINFSIVIINDISDRVMIDKEEEEWEREIFYLFRRVVR